MIKVRNENGEFWATTDGSGKSEEDVFPTIKDAIAASRGFLADAAEDGLDYTPDDIEIVYIRDGAETTMKLSEVLEQYPELMKPFEVEIANDKGDGSAFRIQALSHVHAKLLAEADSPGMHVISTLELAPNAKTMAGGAEDVECFAIRYADENGKVVQSTMAYPPVQALVEADIGDDPVAHEYRDFIHVWDAAVRVVFSRQFPGCTLLDHTAGAC